MQYYDMSPMRCMTRMAADGHRVHEPRVSTRIDKIYLRSVIRSFIYNQLVYT